MDDTCCILRKGDVNEVLHQHVPNLTMQLYRAAGTEPNERGPPPHSSFHREVILALSSILPLQPRVQRKGGLSLICFAKLVYDKLGKIQEASWHTGNR